MRELAWAGLEAAIIELERVLPPGWSLESLRRVGRLGEWCATAEHRGARITSPSRPTMHGAVMALRDRVRQEFPGVAA